MRPSPTAIERSNATPTTPRPASGAATRGSARASSSRARRTSRRPSSRTPRSSVPCPTRNPDSPPRAQGIDGHPLRARRTTRVSRYRSRLAQRADFAEDVLAADIAESLQIELRLRLDAAHLIVTVRIDQHVADALLACTRQPACQLG